MSPKPIYKGFAVGIVAGLSIEAILWLFVDTREDVAQDTSLIVLRRFRGYAAFFGLIGAVVGIVLVARARSQGKDVFAWTLLVSTLALLALGIVCFVGSSIHKGILWERAGHGGGFCGAISDGFREFASRRTVRADGRPKVPFWNYEYPYIQWGLPGVLLVIGTLWAAAINLQLVKGPTLRIGDKTQSKEGKEDAQTQTTSPF